MKPADFLPDHEHVAARDRDHTLDAEKRRRQVNVDVAS
jgi:hypothetical protein